MNSREQLALAALETAQANLAAVRQDLATRDTVPAYQLAVTLYARGYRVEGWGLILTDTYNETTFWNVNQSRLTKTIVFCGGEVGEIGVGYYADGTDRRTEHVPEYLAAHESDLGSEEEMWEALHYLDDLTVEGAGSC